MSDTWEIDVESARCVLLSSDFSQQEPKLTAFASQDPDMIRSFQENKDIYSFIAAIAFNKTYEECLEFMPTGEVDENGEPIKVYNPSGKARRGEAKTIVLGILYGRSVVTIADQLYSKEDWDDDKKVKQAQYVYDSVLKAFPALKRFMYNAQKMAHDKGYVETILGRRRHIPDMMLDEFEFKAEPGYVNPDVDPLDISTLNTNDDIPERVKKALYKELKSYKYYGQVIKRFKELHEVDHIKVINNRHKISEASRQCVNCVDFETEILTVHGWKKYNEIDVGEQILSFNMDTCEITQDSVQAVHIYEENFDVIQFKSPTFESVSTLDHKWVTCESTEKPRFITTEHINKNRWPDYPILRIADNSFSDNDSYSDDTLKLIGWLLTDGHFEKNCYGVHLYQSTRRSKNECVYRSMIETLNHLNIQYTDSIYQEVYHDIYLFKCDITSQICQDFPDRSLTTEFILSLSQRQAELVMWSMIEGDGTLGDNHKNITFCCNSKYRCDMFQLLAVVAGYATNSYTIQPEQANQYPSSKTIYESVNNDAPVQATQPYYIVSILRVKRAHIYPHHKSRINVPGVWCVTTGNHTWIARRHGKVYITSNSIIQGSAADLTKMALLKVESDERWKELGGQVEVPVHDELVGEVPVENAEEAGEVLSSLMCEAASFLPFSIKCDVTTSYHWSGIEYPCPYDRPDSLTNMSDSEIRWVQYHIYDRGYYLPVFKKDNGDKPEGDEALGVNGRFTDELQSFIDDYKNRYNITSDAQFIQHIEEFVATGKVPNSAQV